MADVSFERFQQFVIENNVRIVDLKTVDCSTDRRLPVAMGEALSALKADRGFLTRGGVFTDPVLDKWLEIKEREFRSVAERPHPFEFALYFDA